MKKLKELSIDELVELYDKNNGFNQAVFNEVYEQAMFWQSEEYKLSGADNFDYHDHYSSFYLTCPTAYGAKSPEKLVGKLDEDYMTEEMKPLYKKLCELNDKMEDAEDWDETRPEYDEMRDIADKLAELYTDMLRALETIDMEYVREELQMIADGERYMSDWETDGTTVYEHITKTYK